MISDPAIRVAISDPLPLFRDGVVHALKTGGFRVQEPADLMAWSDDGKSALVLISLVEAAQWALLSDLERQRPAVTSIALIENITADTGVRAVTTGATAVIPRATSANRLRETCEAVLRGDSVLPTDVVRRLLRSAARWNVDTTLPSERELTWLRRLADGLTVGQIADEAGYSERMMFRLLRDLYTSLGAGNRTEAMLLARERGWV